MVNEGFKCFIHFSQTSLLKFERFFFLTWNVMTFFPPSKLELGLLRCSKLSVLAIGFFLWTISLHFVWWSWIWSSQCSAPCGHSEEGNGRRERRWLFSTNWKANGGGFFPAPKEKTQDFLLETSLQCLCFLCEAVFSCWWNQCLQHFLCFPSLSL